MSKYTAFVIYTVFWQSLVWGMFGYAVFGLGFSGWWLAFALFLASNQYPPKRFGIKGLYHD